VTAPLKEDPVTVPLQETTTLTEDEFDELYVPLIDDEGSTWRDFVPEAAPRNRVWSVVDRQDATYATPGFHAGAVVAYVVTANPWASGEEAVRFDEDLPG
jgi:hypothetical protein